MATSNDLTALKARVAALGFKLVTCDGLREHGRDDNPEYAGLYILDPETDVLEIVSAGSAKDDLDEIVGWCEEEEKKQGLARKLVADGANEEPATARAETVAVYARRELGTVQDVINEVIHVARLGQADNEDPGTAFRAIERIANEGYDILHGEAWDRIGQALDLLERMGTEAKRLNLVDRADEAREGDDDKPANDGMFDLICGIDRVQAVATAVEKTVETDWPEYSLAGRSDAIRLFSVLAAEVERVQAMALNLEVGK
jgi:hypothetical protein